MSVDRKFLDLFWSISGGDEKQVEQAIGKLCEELGKKTGDARANYFAYTRERLIKGLKSFSVSGRSGFSKSLLKFLSEFPCETSDEQLLEMLNKHIYESSLSTKAEETSVKYAYMAVPNILCQTGRLVQLSVNDLRKFIQPLLTLTQAPNMSSQAFRILGLIVNSLPAKITRKLLGDCVRSTSASLNTSETALAGDQLLFLLRAQQKIPGLFRDTTQPIDITVKKFRKIFISGILACSDRTALDLLDSAVQASSLQPVWSALYDAASHNRSPKRLGRLLQLVTQVVSCHGDELTTFCLSQQTVELFASQLTYKKHACFSVASQLLTEMLKTVTQWWLDQNKRHGKYKNATVMETDRPSHCNCASPATLFKCFASVPYPIDFSNHPSVVKPCQFLLDRTPSAVESEDLVMYSKGLMRLFINPKLSQSQTMDEPENAPVENTDFIRVMAANQLQTVLQASLHHLDQVLTTVMEPVLAFLVKTGLTTWLFIRHPNETQLVSKKAATACWISLFRFLNGVFSHACHTDEKVKESPCHIPKLLDLLLRTACEQLEANKMGQGDQVANDVLPHMIQSIDVLKKSESKDKLDMNMAQLHATVCLFALSQPIGDWNQTVTLLDDLAECIKRRTSRKKHINDELPWSAVLADVLLGLLSYPSRMLRSVARLTFEDLITSGNADPRCLKLITDVIQTRLFTGVTKSKSDENVDDEADDSASDLITFQTDFESGQTADEDDVALNEKMEEGSMDEDSEKHAVDESVESSSEMEDAMEAENGEKSSDSDEDDSDNEEIDETKLNLVRESVRQALGPAALNEDEVDSTTYREFTDEEMFSRDAALIAAFRANRMTAPDRKAAERARSLGQMKMRCLDLVACIVQRSTQPELLLPAITVLLELAKLAVDCETKAKRKHKTSNAGNRQRASFVARYGDVPLLHRILDVIKLLSTRSVDAQRNLCAHLTAADPLTSVMQSVVAAAQLPHPSPFYTKSLCIVVQFLYRTAQLLALEFGVSAMEFSAPLIDQLQNFVKYARKSMIHHTVFAAFITECPLFAAQSGALLFDSFKDFLTKYNSESMLTKAEDFAAMQCFGMLAHFFKWIATIADTENVHVVRKLPEKALIQLWSVINSSKLLATRDTISNMPWFSSVAFATVFFDLLRWALKASHKVERPQTIPPEMLNAFRQMPSHLKPIRQAAKRFVTFVESLMKRTGSAVMDTVTREEKIRLKQDQKRARQAKRREKALRAQQRLEATEKTEVDSGTQFKTTKERGADAVLLKTNPKPKEITKFGASKKRKFGQKDKNQSTLKKAKRTRIE